MARVMHVLLRDAKAALGRKNQFMPKQFGSIPANLNWENVRMISMQERTILLIMGREGEKLEIEFESKEQVAKALEAARAEKFLRTIP